MTEGCGPQSIQERTYSFSLRIVQFWMQIYRNPVARPLVRQVLESGTSIGANVEEAQGAHSKKDFAAKMSIARKEARETLYWLRLLRDAGIAPARRMTDIIDESEQIVRILTAIVKSAQTRK